MRSTETSIGLRRPSTRIFRDHRCPQDPDASLPALRPSLAASFGAQARTLPALLQREVGGAEVKLVTIVTSTRPDKPLFRFTLRPEWWERPFMWIAPFRDWRTRQGIDRGLMSVGDGWIGSE